jgi:hypothetical protein
MRTRRLALLASAPLPLGCDPGSPGFRTQAALDRNASGFPLGSPVGDDARRRYRLEVAPSLGYRDTTYTAHAGPRASRAQLGE